MYAGHNITFNTPSVETVEIDDQLKRYENKDDIHQSDVEFHNLMEKISDRRQPNEIARATKLLLKFGGLRHKKMEQEQNPFKKRSFPKFILPFYKRAIEIGSSLFDTIPIKKAIEELEKNRITTATALKRAEVVISREEFSNKSWKCIVNLCFVNRPTQSPKRYIKLSEKFIGKHSKNLQFCRSLENLVVFRNY